MEEMHLVRIAAVYKGYSAGCVDSTMMPRFQSEWVSGI